MSRTRARTRTDRKLRKKRSLAPRDLTNKVPVDRFTLAHFGAGCIGGAFDIDWKLFMAGAVSWEFLEHALKKHHPDLFPNPSQDTMANATCDVLAAGLGFGAMRSLRTIETEEKRSNGRKKRRR